MWDVMLRCTIVLLVAVTAAGCRTGFPSLNGGPEAPPAVLSEARATASTESSQLQQEQAAMAAARSEAAREPAGSADAAPRKLLAALPLGFAETAPSGVIDRAVEASQASSRAVVVVGVGAGSEQAAATVAAAIEVRGIRVLRETVAGETGAPGRVDLYLDA